MNKLGNESVNLYIVLKVNSRLTHKQLLW